MDNVTRNSKSKKKRFVNITPKPSNTIFFVNDKLVRLIRKNKSENIVEYYNIIDGKSQIMLYSDFRKHRKRAYTVVDTSRLLNKSLVQFTRYINSGKIPAPIGASLNGVRQFQKKSYYSEDHIFKIREVLAMVHRGRPRKDGGVTNNSNPSEQELRSKMGDAIMLYTKTKDGNFIPVWSEETW